MNEEILSGGHSHRTLPRPAQAALDYLARRLRVGTLTVETPSGVRLRFVGSVSAEPRVSWKLNNYKPIWALFKNGAIGFGESYMAGDWDTDSLVSMLHLAASNEAHLAAWADQWPIFRAATAIKHRWRSNTRVQARRNIQAHYDLGNDFYARWLDESMSYSAALFTSPEASLIQAQSAKYQRIADLIEIGDAENILEIGCGWGGFMEFAARRGSGDIVGISISDEQCRYAEHRLALAGLDKRTQVINRDYRDIDGRYDRIVSIEMFEAVGERYWSTYASKLKSLLRPGGKAALQVITIDESRFENYRRTPDFIQKYIFPGGMLPSVSALENSLSRAGLETTDTFKFGLHYAETLARWRERFEREWSNLARLGFGDRFRRMWLFYLTYCEAGFRTGAIDVLQVRVEHQV